MAVDPRSILADLVATVTPAAVKALERNIGFEGTADPASGYYCLYDGGRRVVGNKKGGGASNRPSLR